MNSLKIKTRSACNRCHAQKLRCIRKSDPLRCERCERCSRLGTLCHFAPRVPRGSRKPAPPNTGQKSPSSSPIAETGQEIELDWLLQGDSWLLGSIDVSSQGQENTTNGEETFWSPDVFDTQVLQNLEQPPSPSGTTRELANLSIALFELTTNLPSSEETPCASENTRSGTFVFDDLFHSTTQFINILQHHLGIIDEATTLMLASCHSRLIEIYATVLSLMERCIQHSGPVRRALVLPEVQLGSLSFPAVHVGVDILPLGKTAMYMCMIAVFSGDLWVQLADAVKGWQRVERLESFVRNLWMEMGRRSDTLLVSIENIKGLLP
ncbi:hypothetical protein BDW59DRAFT_151924 [Aspergillus cavernicola]|uniref:Zn(2)-C6 fungal-type domain-containing protein n=1 Tax=Aspergillus cavernicola TaxID=176166 RepID=A0ABR4HTC4_9EURO